MEDKMENKMPTGEENKFRIGILLSILMSLVGLLVGCLLYPKDTYSRFTFVKGWAWGCLIFFLIMVFIGGIVALALKSAGII